MDAAFLEEWNGKFGAELKPPEWVLELCADVDKQQEDVQRKITESASRVDKLQEELDQELFLLSWLRKLREKNTAAEESVEDSDHVLSEKGQEVPKDSLAKPVATAEPSLEDPKEASSPQPGTPDTAIGERSIQPTTSAQTSESSPSDSEDHTAGQDLNREEDSAASRTRESAEFTERKRFVHGVSAKDLLVAKEVSQRVLKKHSSCDNLVKFARGDSSEKGAGGRKRKRIKSAPTERVQRSKSPEAQEKVKRRFLSSPVCTAAGSTPSSADDSNLVGDSPLVNSQTPTSPTEVVLRDKVVRRPSFPTMSQEEALTHWKGTGGPAAISNRSSSNCEDYNFLVNKDDEDSDPALINVMASRIRGSLRTPRSSVSNDQPLSSELEKSERQLANGGGEGSREVTSPKDDQSNTPVPGAEPPASTIAPLRKRSTQDSSPLKRFSYQYSDDECLTPKIDSGDHGGFPGPSPAGSNGCSNRNSRSSNGIIDEEDPSSFEMTLRRQETVVQGVKRKDRTSTITPGNASSEDDGSRLAERPSEDPGASGSGGDSDVTSTLTGRPLNSESIFEKSDSYTDELGSLDIDIELTLSKLRDKPEMSMATLLDMDENERMNARANTQPSSYPTKQRTPDGMEFDIDEATISAFTLSHDLYGSRSNSASSIPGLFSDSNSGTSPEQESPTHMALQGVNLRQSHGAKKMNRRRMGNADFEMMAGGVGSDSEEKSHSRSSTSLNSEESIPTSPPSDEDSLVRACSVISGVSV